MDDFKLKLEDKEEMVTKLQLESDAYQKDLENYIAKTNVSYHVTCQVRGRLQM